MYSEDVSPNSRIGVVAQSAGSNKYESVYGMDEGNASASAEHDVTPSYEPVKFDDPTYETILDLRLLGTGPSRSTGSANRRSM